MYSSNVSSTEKVATSQPHHLKPIGHPGGFATTGGLNPVRFLLHDNGPGNALNSRIVIFATDENLRRLANADRRYADGNFKLVPTIFKQLYIIRIRIGRGAYITVMYLFLENESRVLYREMWGIIEHECQQRNFIINVAHLVIDFEQAVINSFHFVFGNHVQRQGCFFHFNLSA